MAKSGTDFVSVAEAAARLGVTDRQVRNLIASGALAARQVGRAFIIDVKDLAKLPKDRKPGPKPKK